MSDADTVDDTDDDTTDDTDDDTTDDTDDDTPGDTPVDVPDDFARTYDDSDADTPTGTYYGHRFDDWTSFDSLRRYDDSYWTTSEDDRLHYSLCDQRPRARHFPCFQLQPGQGHRSAVHFKHSLWSIRHWQGCLLGTVAESRRWGGQPTQKTRKLARQSRCICAHPLRDRFGWEAIHGEGS